MGMGYGLLGALGGLGEAGVSIGKQMMDSALKSDLQKEQLEILVQKQERLDKLKEKREQERRRAFVTELDKASATKAAPDLANLSKAREIYSGLEGEDREAGLRAVDEAEGRVNADSRKLSGLEVAKAGLLSGVIDGKDYMTAIRSDGSNDVKLAIADGRINMLKDQLEFRNKQLETTDATRRRGQDLRAETTQRGQDITAETAANRQVSGGSGGSGKSSNTEDKSWEKTASEYNKFFVSKNQLGNEELDAVGKAAFRRMMSMNRLSGVSAEEAADDAVNAIQTIRRKSMTAGELDKDLYAKNIEKLFKPRQTK